MVEIRTAPMRLGNVDTAKTHAEQVNREFAGTATALRTQLESAEGETGMTFRHAQKLLEDLVTGFHHLHSVHLVALGELERIDS